MANPQYPGAFAPPPPPTNEKPTAAAVLSIVGGVFVLIGGLVALWVSSVINSLTLGTFGGGLLVLSAIGVLSGVLMLVLGALMLVSPQHHVAFGALVIVLSIVSLVTALFGGFLIGFILGLIGGIMGVTWKPTPVYVAYHPVMAAPAPTGRVCLKCGRMVPPDTKFCPHCGNALA